MSWKVAVRTVVAVALVAGCSAKPLDAPVTVTGRRSFVVTSTLSAADGSEISPASHVFTMVVDRDAKTVIVGGFGNGGIYAIVPDEGGFHLFSTPISLATATGACPPTVRYNDLSVTLGETGPLVGHGSGELMTDNGGARASTAVTMSFTGVADAVPPALTWLRSAEIVDPFNVLVVMSSEPLPAQPTPSLRAASGDVLSLASGTAPPFTVYFDVMQPPILQLRYGEQYSVDISGVRDFAGNAAFTTEPGGLTFTTRPSPPLAVADGFESLTDTTFGGAQVLSGAGDPVISGTRSLYVPGPALGSAVNFAVRVAVAPGASAVHFAYRYVNGGGFFYSIQHASVGGSIWETDLPQGDGAMTAGTIGGTQVMLGPVMSATLPVFGGASGEVVINHTVANLVNECELPVALPPPPGLIIDDLRSE